MSAIRSTDTTPERRLRSHLHRLGVRYRLGQVIRLDVGRPIKPDLVSKRYRVAVFVDGCFWHGCREHCRMPSSNSAYWLLKIGGNMRRDGETDTRLSHAGWTVVRIWEHEDPLQAAERLRDLLAREK